MNISAIFGSKNVLSSINKGLKVKKIGVKVKYEGKVTFFTFPDDLPLCDQERYLLNCIQHQLRMHSISGLFHAAFIENKWVCVRSSHMPSKATVQKSI